MALDSFITHSHYPQEKIIWAYEGEISPSNPYWRDDIYILNEGLAIPVPENFVVENILVDGIWSIDDWATSYLIGTTSEIYGWEDEGGGVYHSRYDSAYAGVVNLRPPLSYTPYFYAGADITSGAIAKIRFWAYLANSDTQSYTIGQTASQLAHDLQKTTALAQMNLISENVLSIPDGSTEVLYHNLGFRPYCKIWRRQDLNWGYTEWGTDLSLKTGSPSSSDNNILVIDDTKIKITAEDPFHLGKTQDFLIRIYNYAIPQ